MVYRHPMGDVSILCACGHEKAIHRGLWDGCLKINCTCGEFMTPALYDEWMKIVEDARSAPFKDGPQGTPPVIIGLAGRAGSGKSTCARWLVENYGAVEFSLAEPLKRLAMDVFDFTEVQVFGTQLQKETVDARWGISPREALIRMGNSARKHLGEDVWLNACLLAIENADVPLAVISDVRYPNEASAVRNYGGYVVRLSCPDSETLVDPNAPSERSVDGISAEDVSFEISAKRSLGAANLLMLLKEALGPVLRRP